VKTILTTLLLVLSGLAAGAAPQFLPLPGTPEGDALARTSASAPAPAVAAPAVPALIPAAPAAVTPPPAVAPATVETNNPSARHAAPHRAVAPPAFPAFPGQPGAPAMPAPAGLPPGTALPPGALPGMPAPASPVANLPVMHPHELHFQAAKLEAVLTVYTSLVKRNLLRSPQLPDAAITFDNVTDLTYDEAIQALNGVLGMNGITIFPVGDKFVKVVPTASAIQEAAPLNSITNASDLPELGGYVTHVVQLKYSKPSEVATALASFAKVQGSILPLDSNGILIIRDFSENVKRMLEMIDQIDVAVPSEFVSEVIPIKYALASDIASALNSVGGGSVSSIGGTGTGAATSRTSGATGMPGATGRPYGATGTTTGLGQGAANGLNRGVPGTAGGAAAGAAGAAQPTFAQRLQTLINKAGSGGDFQILGPNKIIPDERTNSLLVFATRQDMDTIKDIVAKLDVVLAQVLIESVILDITLADNFNFGVSAGQAPNTLAGNASGGGGLNNASGILASGQAFLNNLIPIFGTNTVSGSNIITGYTASTNVTFPSSDGLTYFGKFGAGPTWNVALAALAGKDNVKILARPSIQTSHAVPASIFVGETRPYITGTTYDSYNGGSQAQYQQAQIGISLNVTPLINPDGLVVMDIQQQVQQVGGSVTIDGNAVPITQDQNASSKVAVKNGETIVMGGFIQDQKSDSKSGIPYLQDIPLLGRLFTSTSKSGSRRELMVMIRPTVLPTPEAAALQTDVMRNRLPAVKAAEADFNDEEAGLLKQANKKTAAKPADQK
jgi:general secretion pathway protein D